MYSSLYHLLRASLRLNRPPTPPVTVIIIMHDVEEPMRLYGVTDLSHVKGKEVLRIAIGDSLVFIPISTIQSIRVEQER